MKTNVPSKMWSNPTVRKYLIFSGCDYLTRALTSATYVLFLLSRGANLWQAGLINVFFMVTIIAMEVPTGAFADHCGRRLSLTVGCLLTAGGCFFYFFADAFWLFVTAEIIVGVGRTFVSGALDAWLVDSLHHENQSPLKAKVFRRRQLFEAGGLAVGGLIGARLGGYGLAWPWLLASGSILLIALYSLSFRELYRSDEITSFKKTHLTLAWHVCGRGLKNPNLIYAMAFGAILSLALQAVNMQWTKFFQDQYQLSVSHLGWLIVGVALAKASSGPLSSLANHLTGNEKKSLVITQTLTALAIILIAQVSNLTLAVSVFLLHEVGREIFLPLKQNYLNNQITTKHRATILSLDSMLVRIGSLSGLLLSGWLATAYSIRLAWTVSGLLLLIAALLFLLIKRKPIKPQNGL